jgi:hypothetical protein
MVSKTSVSNIVGPSSEWHPTSKTINVRVDTWRRLQKYMVFGSTYDSVIRSILDEKEQIIDSDAEGIKND